MSLDLERAGFASMAAGKTETKQGAGGREAEAAGCVDSPLMVEKEASYSSCSSSLVMMMIVWRADAGGAF